MDVPEGKSDSVAELGESPKTNLKTADIVIDGALLETKLIVYGKVGMVHN